jgi:hypothetical protein
MNRDEAKLILLVYRPGVDAEDPQIAGALALAKSDRALGDWLEGHYARQNALREKFRQISAPAKLKEQIISERAAFSRMDSRREKMVAVAAIAAIVVALVVLAATYLPRRGVDVNTLANYQSQMIYVVTSGYGMNLATNDLPQIRDYLARNQSPADYILPAPLEKTAVTGCAIEDWQGKKVSMICFSTGKPLPPNQAGDLWLFVTDRASMKGAPDSTAPQFAKTGRIVIVTWTQGGKLYLLATEGDEQTIRKYL